MYMILPSRSTKSTDYISEEKPVDWAFMEESEKVLDDLPDTWKKYDGSVAGRSGIIDMEYLEFKQAKTPDEMKHELVHLASACLHLWRRLNHAE